MSFELPILLFARRAARSGTAQDQATDPCAALTHVHLAAGYDRVAARPARDKELIPAACQHSKPVRRRMAKRRRSPFRIAQAIQLSNPVGLQVHAARPNRLQDQQHVSRSDHRGSVLYLRPPHRWCGNGGDKQRQSNLHATRGGTDDLWRKPAVILCDNVLIEGPRQDAVRSLKAAYTDVPVVFITARPDTCAPCLPPDTVVTKPLHVDDLMAFCTRAPS